MKRLLVHAVLLLLAIPALAATVRERDILLTRDGVVYTVEAVHDKEVAEGRSPDYLRLTIQREEKRSTELIPGAILGGAHGQPALAYDSESDTLFVFWQEQLFRVASRLLFASYRDGVWSDVSELDSVTWKLRRNLRIAVTRAIETKDEEGAVVQAPQLVVHAVWWESAGQGEFARYAMLGIDDGVVTSTNFRYLIEFFGTPLSVDATDPTVNANAGSREALRSPAITSTSSRDAVDVLFGDATTNTMRRLRIKPVLDGRIRIPIGVRGGNLRNMDLNVASGARVAAVIEEDTVALYAVGNETLDYVVYRNGVWSKQRSIALTEELTPDTAVDALRRMVRAH